MKIQIVRIYDKYLDNSELEARFINDEGKEFYGPLFWGKDEGQRVTRIKEEVSISNEGSFTDRFTELTSKYKNLCEKYGIKFFKDTVKTMNHWQFVNGFSDIYIINM